METLLRTRSGRFTLDEAKRLSEIEQMQEEGSLEECLIPVDRIFETYPKAVVKDDHLVAVANGNRLQKDWIRVDREEQDAELFRIYDGEGKFFGLYEAAKEPGFLKPRQMFI